MVWAILAPHGRDPLRNQSILRIVAPKLGEAGVFAPGFPRPLVEGRSCRHYSPLSVSAVGS